jgi:hypothetical protein
MRRRLYQIAPPTVIFILIRRMVMYKQYIGSFALALLTSIAQTVDAGGPSGALRAEAPAPVILSAKVDTVQRRLVISGVYFGRLPPTVTLGGQALSVVSFSPTEAVASLPADIDPATYLLTIKDAQNPRPANSVDLQIPSPE